MPPIRHLLLPNRESDVRPKEALSEYKVRSCGLNAVTGVSIMLIHGLALTLGQSTS